MKEHVGICANQVSRKEQEQAIPKKLTKKRDVIFADSSCKYARISQGFIGV
jgi:hypothetical protein